MADKLLKKMKFSLSALKGKGLANKLQEYLRFSLLAPGVADV